MGVPVSIRQFAKMRGVSHTAVAKAIKTGRIALTKDGKIDPDVAGPAWDANTDASKRREAPVSDERRGPEIPVEGPTPSAGKSQGSGPRAAQAYAVARAIREEYSARSARLEFESKAGQLVPANQVKMEAYNAARLARDSLMLIPDRISHQLAAETNPDKIHQKLTEVIHAALEELAAAGRRRAGVEDPEHE